MPSLKQELDALCEPANIRNAGLASSPYVLRKVFATDRRILRVIERGRTALPAIEEILSGRRKLPEISLAAFAFIVESIQPSAAPSVLGPTFRIRLKTPGPFFVHFAAHALRTVFQLPLKPTTMVYSGAELAETSARLY